MTVEEGEFWEDEARKFFANASVSEKFRKDWLGTDIPPGVLEMFRAMTLAAIEASVPPK